MITLLTLVNGAESESVVVISIKAPPAMPAAFKTSLYVQSGARNSKSSPSKVMKFGSPYTLHCLAAEEIKGKVIFRCGKQIQFVLSKSYHRILNHYERLIGLEY